MDFADHVRLFFRLRVWVFVPAFLTGVAFMWLAWLEGEHPRAIDEDRRTVVGMVTAMADPPVLTIGYEYTVDDQVYSAQAPVSQQTFDQLSPGGTVSVFYAGGMPEVSEIEVGTISTLSWVFLAIEFLFLAVALGLFAWQMRAFASARRAANGPERRVRVLRVAPVGNGLGRRTLRGLFWMGENHEEQRSRGSAARELVQYRDGGAITVKVDPRTGQEWWLEDLR